MEITFITTYILCPSPWCVDNLNPSASSCGKSLVPYKSDTKGLSGSNLSLKHSFMLKVAPKSWIDNSNIKSGWSECTYKRNWLPPPAPWPTKGTTIAGCAKTLNRVPYSSPLPTSPHVITTYHRTATYLKAHRIRHWLCVRGGEDPRIIWAWRDENGKCS